MPAPYDYRINIPDPTQSVLSGVQTGLNISNVMAQRQQAQAEAESQRRMQEAIGALSQKTNPTAADYVSVANLLPKQQADSLRASWETLSKEQQENNLNFAGQVMAAFDANPQVGVDLLNQRAEAERNAGNEQQAKAYETWARIAEINPSVAKQNIGIMLASVPGGDRTIEGITKLGQERREAEMAPAELTAAQAKAQKAAVEARFAESSAVLDLEKKGWDITKIQNDAAIAKENARIAAINADINREQNELKREELRQKLADMEMKRDQAVRERAAEAESASGSIDNMLNTADRILQTPMGVVGSAAGPVSSRVPTLTQDTADFEELVNTLGSQAFLAQIPNIKGMGALSNAEGEKLTAALQNFSLRQSPERLLENVREAQRLLLKARSNIANRLGVPESIPDTPAAEPSPDEISALLQKYGAQ